MWRLAWRNLWRSRTRTAITGSAIALSLALQLISYGTADAIYEKMMGGAVEAAGGNVLLQGKGFWEAQSLDITVEDPRGVVEAVSRVPGVVAAIPRVTATALVSSARSSVGVQLQGIDPVAEAQLSDLGRFVVRGTYLGPEVADPIVLGAGIALDLHLELGDRVVITATDPEGEMVRALFHLGGILETGSAATDDFLAITRIETAQKALGLGERVTQVGVLVSQDGDRGGVRDALLAALGERARAMEALTWDEAMPALMSFVELDSAMAEVFGWVVFLVVAFGIANTFLMAVLERTRELGLLAAIGLTPGATARLVVAETLLLGAVFIALGLALGLLGHWYLSAVGIDIAQMSGMDIEISGVVLDDMVIHSRVVWSRWLGTSLGVLGLVVLSGLYPAWKTTRLSPTEAMRTYE
jgi:ABC-type lipoprotein release transport system permease subunit